MENTMRTPLIRDRYDVIIAGARVAGSATAMLLGRAGLRVLAVDPVELGRDTLSTHALMRGGVLQLHRWGLLDKIRAAGTPQIKATTFHYGKESVTVPIRPSDGVDALFAPRRTVIDPILVAGARDAGVDVVHGLAVTDLIRDRGGRVRGVEVTSSDRTRIEIRADLVIGADGLRSKVARLVDAPVDYTVPHATASIYGYWPGLENEGYQWHFEGGQAIGRIPTNAGDTCVFASVPPSYFHAQRHRGLDAVYGDIVRGVAPELAARLRDLTPSSKLRAFPGAPSMLRRAAGPGWALVGDAGYFKDPLTAHGITDALRDAELLARAAIRGEDEALLEYQVVRDGLSRGFLDVTNKIAACDWTLEELKTHHMTLSREMSAEVELLKELDAPLGTPVGPEIQAEILVPT
jgi:flavin-dependent dehydrogenase